jgi:hypothetical protein
MAALEQQLVAPILEGFFDLPSVGRHVRDIGFGVARDAIKVAEFAIGDTDIGGVHIPVYLPGHAAMGHLLLPQLIANEHQVCQGGVMVEVHTFFHAQETKFKGFPVQPVQFRVNCSFHAAKLGKFNHGHYAGLMTNGGQVIA